MIMSVNFSYYLHITVDLTGLDDFRYDLILFHKISTEAERDTHSNI